MFGWEFPPHISGGLGTACRGLTKSLTKENTHVIFVIPKADNIKKESGLNIVSASQIVIPSLAKATQKSGKKKSSITTRKTNSKKTETGKLTTVPITSGMAPYMTADVLNLPYSLIHWNFQFNDTTSVQANAEPGISEDGRYPFSGGYGPGLIKEVQWFTDVAAEVAKQYSFDVIHAHDWLTFAAGMVAKKVSGKPLVVHVHATEFDRAGNNINHQVFQSELAGMEIADRIVAVSQMTKDTIVRNYHIPDSKVEVVHNGVEPRNGATVSNLPSIGRQVVTYLGRITYQKGPQYFVEAANRVLQKFPEAHFVMAGSGDLLPKMIDRVAQLKISSHFHFTGFLKGEQLDKVWAVTRAYVMPSVSEPFGITPLEAIQAGIPVIISKQSGVSEVVNNAIKVDFWDTEALADAICNILQYESLSKTLKSTSHEELRKLTWGRAARKINQLYHELIAEPEVPEHILPGTPAKKAGTV
jgi:glycogen(starch) synthase